MRQFYLRDYYTGEEYALQNGSVFLHNPAGLGFENDKTFSQIDGFFVEITDKITQVEKTGTFVFAQPNAYTAYKNFIDWLQLREKIVFVYQPGNTKYFQNIEIISIAKGEIEPYGTLECDFVFVPTSPIYLPNNIYYNISGASASDITEYTFDYTSEYPPSSISGSVEINVVGQMDSDWQIVINGPIDSPVLTASVDGANIGKVDLSDVELTSGQKIRFNTVVDRAGAVRINTDNTETDLTNQLGLSSSLPTFFRFPKAKTTTLQLTAESLTDVSAIVTVYNYFRSI